MQLRVTMYYLFPESIKADATFSRMRLTPEYVWWIPMNFDSSFNAASIFTLMKLSAEKNANVLGKSSSNKLDCDVIAFNRLTLMERHNKVTKSFM